MELRFNIDHLSLDDMIAVTEGRKLSDIKRCMVKTLVDENNAPVPDADKVIGAIQYKDFADAANRFAQAMSEAREGAIPPTGGGK
jgi:predicted transcriptional regulator